MMGRLTKRAGGTVVYAGGYKQYEGGDIPAEVSPQGVRELLVRLAEYEDTGLMHGEIKSMQEEHFSGLEMAKLHSALMELKKYQEADKDGRIVVLPCKVGQRVFALLDTDKHISECEVKQIGMGNEIGFIGLEPICARGREYGVALNGFGKTVFLTREEAEKALEAMKDG